MELISIVIPVYNGEAYLEACLDSILQQTHNHYEVIAVDDGSTDESLPVLRDYATRYPNIHVIHTENHGVCHARNLGLSGATGAYVTFVDADDRLLPDALERMYGAIREHRADIAIFSKIYVHPGREAEARPAKESEIEIWEGDDVLRHSLEDHPAGHSVYAKLYKRETIGDVRFIEGRRVHEDSFFVFQCFARCNRAVYHDVGVYSYYITPGSASRSLFSDKYFDILYFAERKADMIRECRPAFESYIPALLVRANMSMLYNLSKTYDHRYRSRQKEYLRFVRRNSRQFKAVYRSEKRFLAIIRSRLFWAYKLYLFYKTRCVSVRTAGKGRGSPL